MSNTEPGQENGPSLQEMYVAVDEWKGELRAMLPTLPDQFEVGITEEHSGEPQFSNEDDIWNYAVGGATLTPTTMSLTIDKRIKVSPSELFEQLKQTYYHEGYHLARGFSFASPDLSLMDVALEEGLATKFEMLRAGSDPRYAQYDDRNIMLQTLDEVVAANKQSGDVDWPKWKFYDPETERSWILYRVGTFLVDDILDSHPELTIEDLAVMPREDIFALTDLEIK